MMLALAPSQGSLASAPFVQDESADEASGSTPSKRQRSDSPDDHHSTRSSSFSFSYSSCASIEHLTTSPFFLHFATSPSTSPTSLHPSSGIPLRSILSPGSSPPVSRPLSRQSSTSYSSKSVRFARCTNASVYRTHSTDDYDRSPIIPTCAEESLNLPARCAETDRWVKCVQRAHSADKERRAQAAATGKAPPTTVEGVHGLVGGGYFRGANREQEGEIVDDDPVDEEEDDDGMLVDDQVETGTDQEEDGEDEQSSVLDHEEHLDLSEQEDVPQLTTDDSSSGGEDSDSALSHEASLASTPIARPLMHMPFAVPLPDVAAVALASPEKTPSPIPVASNTTSACPVAAKARDRYGMCALGKFTRAEVFESFDSFGGF